MRITVANWDARPENFKDQAKMLTNHVRAFHSDLVLLPEMPFSLWLSLTNEKRQAEWVRSVAEHEEKIPELSKTVGVPIAGSRPVVSNDDNFNQAFLWPKNALELVMHQKTALPEEDGYWEARWYKAGTQSTSPMQFDDLNVGFAICTEVWDTNHTQRLANSGADVLLAPRATPDLGDDVWVAGLRALAVQTGCYVLSSNFAYPLAEDFVFEGLSVACDPDGGLLAVSSPEQPFATVEVEPNMARIAKKTYPRYIFAAQNG